jgi:predicted esterase
MTKPLKIIPPLQHENGFNFALYAAKTDKPKHVIVYLHGLGSNVDINDGFIEAMHAKIPDADIISVQAPIRMRILSFLNDNAREGYSWLHLGETLRSQIFNRLSIATKIERFALAQLEKRGLTQDQLAYFGTSMGGIVALQAGLTGKTTPAAIVSRSGAVLPFTRVKSRPPVFLQIGNKDKLFYDAPKPKGFLAKAFAHVAGRFSLRYSHSIERLQKQNVPVTAKAYPGQGHTLNQEAWNDSIDFIAKAFAAKP